MVFYRQYRPQKIEELDSKEIRDTLHAVLSKRQNEIHAFLFTGPKGLGKTSTARIVAKVLNCQRIVKERIASSSENKKLNVHIEPCNECDQCLSITNGSNLDVLEIDAASNRGIDEIRDLREKIKLSPVAARKKVYIIDEVHMLTTEAFNALLKTLEEPPSHVVFILCTTEPQKIPSTIISRCFHISFKLATKEELLRSFKRIISDQEKLSIDDEALSYIVDFSEGSFRDGVKILEELILISEGQKITKEFIEKKYKTSSIKYYISKLIESLVKKDAKEGILIVKELSEQGIDMKYFLEQLISELHKILLVKVGVENSEVKIQNSELKIEEIKELVEVLSKAYGEIKYAVLPQLPLEIAIIEWSQVLKSSSHLNDSSNASVPPSSSAGLGIRSPSATLVKNSFREKTPRTGANSDKTQDIWQKLIEEVKKQNHSVAGVLRGCSLISCNEKELVIEAKYKFHKDRLTEPKTIEILEKAGEEITGKNIKILVELKQ